MAASDFDKDGKKIADAYWDNREREMENLAKQEKYIKSYNKRLDEIFNRMIDEITREIEAFYGKYATSEGIDITEAKKRMDKMDVQAFAKQAAALVKKKGLFTAGQRSIEAIQPNNEGESA